MLAKELQMLNGSYAFITLDFYLSPLLIKTTQSVVTMNASQILDCFNGIITLTVKRPSVQEKAAIKEWILNHSGLNDSEITSAVRKIKTSLIDI